MQKIEYRFTGDDPVFQSRAIEVLARCFDVWAERKVQYNNRFPFREYSFVAVAESGETVGHLGIIPFDVAGDNRIIRMAGVASVAVDPQWRNCGIASGLCRHAVEWAKNNNFDAMPLYTSLMPVYEKSGWQVFQTAMKTLVRPVASPDDSAAWKIGEALTADEKSFIVCTYENMPSLPGKVIRVHDDYAAQSWGRLFSKPNHCWYIADNGYILSVDGVIAEIGGEVDKVPSGINAAFLPTADPAFAYLAAAGWQIAGADGEIPPCWDGEVVMMNIFHPENIPAGLPFALAHKF